MPGLKNEIWYFLVPKEEAKVIRPKSRDHKETQSLY